MYCEICWGTDDGVRWVSEISKHACIFCRRRLQDQGIQAMYYWLGDVD